MRKVLERYAYIPVALLLLAYSLLRAIRVGITFDEVYTFFYYVLDTYDKIYHYTYLTSNNHMLGSVLEKACLAILPLSELSLRIPSLIGHVLFLIFAWGILGDIKSPYLRLGAYILVCGNVYLLDFFSLARGYGLSMGFMMGAFYYTRLFYSLEKRLFLYQLLALLMGGLAVLSNFSVLHIYLALMAVIAFWTIQKLYQNPAQRPNLLLGTISAYLLGALPFLLYSIDIGMKLKAHNELYFGGNNGFWQDTVHSLVSKTLYGAAYQEQWQSTLMTFVAITIILSALYLALMLLRSPGKLMSSQRSLLSVFMLLFLAFLSAEVQHLLMGTLFVVERSALLFIVLFMLLTVYLWYHLYMQYKWVLIFPCLLLGLTLTHFVNMANTSYCLDWKKDSAVKQMMQDLNADVQSKFVEKGKECYFQPAREVLPACLFYKYYYHYQWLPTFDYQDYNYKEDYIFSPANELGKFKNKAFVKCKYYASSDYYLMYQPCIAHKAMLDTLIGPAPVNVVKATEYNKIKLPGYAINDIIKIEQGDYADPNEIPVGNWLKGDSQAFIHITFDYYSENNDHNFDIEIAMKTAKQNVYTWNGFNMRREYIKQGKWNTINLMLNLPPIKGDGCLISIVKLNHEKLPVYLHHLRVRVEG